MEELFKMFIISTNLVKLSDRLLLFLLLLSLLPMQRHLSTATSEPTDSTCKSTNEHLDSMYRCRPSEFQVSSFCATQSPYHVTCNRSNRIAIFSASIGLSSDRRCSETDSPVSSQSFGPSDAASDCCLVQSVERKCHGKHKCSVNVTELLDSVDGRQCSPRNRRNLQTSQKMEITFICVNRKTIRELKRGRTSADTFCEGHSRSDGFDSTDGLRQKPVNMVRIEERPLSHRLPPTETSHLTSPDTDHVLGAEDSESTAVYRGGGSGGGSLDWMWTMIFIRDNMDRFLIYLFLSIAVGVIVVLMIVIIGICLGRCWRKRKTEMAKTSGHMTQSSTQTSDVTTSLVASSQTPGIEMIHYAQTDSLQTPRPNGNSSMTGNSVHFAPDNFISQQGMKSTGNGGSTYLNLPNYQINSSADSVDGGDRAERVGDHEEHRSNTLGKFYTNPYRHDSYRSDGYRTLQHK